MGLLLILHDVLYVASWGVCNAIIVARHAAVAERLHAWNWHGDVHRLSVSGVHWNDVPWSRRV